MPLPFSTQTMVAGALVKPNRSGLFEVECIQDGSSSTGSLEVRKTSLPRFWMLWKVTESEILTKLIWGIVCNRWMAMSEGNHFSCDHRWDSGANRKTKSGITRWSAEMRGEQAQHVSNAKKMKQYVEKCILEWSEIELGERILPVRWFSLRGERVSQ